MDIENEIRLLRAQIELETILLKKTEKGVFFFYGWMACTSCFLIAGAVFSLG